MILRNDPNRMRNFLLRNELHLNRQQSNIDRIRNHYRITSADINRINAQIVAAQRYASIIGQEPIPIGRC